jgi:hypothetical protein
MEDYVDRKPTVTDAMILVAAVAAGLASWRSVLAMPIMRSEILRDSPQWFYFQALGLTALLVPLSLGLLVLVGRQPRPGFRRRLGRPAALVGLTVLIVFAIDTAILLVLMMLVGFSRFHFAGGKVFYYCRLLGEQTGMCLATACCSRAIAGRCRGPMSSHWLDLLGWAIGVCWILLAIGSAFFTLFDPG